MMYIYYICIWYDIYIYIYTTQIYIYIYHTHIYICYTSHAHIYLYMINKWYTLYIDMMYVYDIYVYIYDITFQWLNQPSSDTAVQAGFSDLEPKSSYSIVSCWPNSGLNMLCAYDCKGTFGWFVTHLVFVADGAQGNTPDFEHPFWDCYG